MPGRSVVAAVAVVVDDEEVVGVVVAGVVAEQAVPVGLTENGGTQDLVGCALGDESSIEDQHPVAVASLVQVVGGDHHGRPGRSLLADHLEDPLLAGEVETGDRLVEQQQRRMPGECLRHEGPLPLAAGEFADLAVEQVADFESGDGVVDSCPIAVTLSAERRGFAAATSSACPVYQGGGIAPISASVATSFY